MQEKIYWNQKFFLLDPTEVTDLQNSHSPHDWGYLDKKELVNPNGEFVQGHGDAPLIVTVPAVRVCRVCKKVDTLVLGKALNRVTKEVKTPVHTPDYSVSDWIIDPDLSAVENVPVKYWKITGDVVSEMDQSEKDALDLASLPDAKINRKRYLITQSDSFTESRGYTVYLKGRLLSMYSEGKRNRVKYIQPLIDWLEQVDNEVLSKQNDVDNATTLAEVNAIAIDTATLAAADPQITVEGALGTKALRQKNFQVSSYDNLKRLSTITYYETDNGDGTYSGKSEQTTYTYVDNKTTLLRRKVEVFCTDGTVFSEDNFDYYKNNKDETIEKKN